METNVLVGIGCFFAGIALVSWMIYRVVILPIERALDDAWGGEK